jgi:O-succinylbenzoic acid--CoA ligase
MPIDDSDLLSVPRAAREAGAAEFLVSGDQRWSFSDLATRVAAATRELQAAGVGAGDRVAVQASNRPGLAPLALALAELDATLVPLHPRLTDAEVSLLVADCAPRLFLDGNAVDSLIQTSPPRPLSLPGEGEGADRRASPPPLSPGRGGRGVRSPLAMLYTSGTTGKPKGALLPRSAFVAAAAASHRNLPCGPGDRWVLCLPLCHIGGLSIVTRCVAGRATVILLPRFDPAGVIEAIERERATLLSVVPTMLRALLETDLHDRMAGLRAVLVGGAAAPAELLEECARRGILALTTYGLTEACSQVCSQGPRDRFSREPGSGVPLAGAELRILPLDAPGGESPDPAGAGEPGRIQIRGPMMMTGYHGHPPLAGGWFETGDLGHLDDQGRIHLHARRTDLIVSGGENVYPAEVEAVLLTHPQIVDAAVAARPDAEFGEAVVAVLVARAGAASPSLEAVRAFCKERLAGFKAPR